jgi:hypothetical protein
VAEKKGTDWTFKKMLFRDCLITSANPSNVVIDGAPAATFNGIILGFTADSDLEIPDLNTETVTDAESIVWKTASISLYW